MRTLPNLSVEKASANPNPSLPHTPSPQQDLSGMGGRTGFWALGTVGDSRCPKYLRIRSSAWSTSTSPTMYRCALSGR